MSYTLDVYYRRAKPERHLGQFALFVSYFPQLVAGPIERFSHLNEQLKVEHKLAYKNLQLGFRLMLYGFFVKMVIADNLSYTVSSIFNDPGKWKYYWNIIGVLSFGFQIYADFFGYSLIAQGAAKLFGIELMDNFNRPYLSNNISEFWKRWHISLSTWFRDYVYIPLGGNRVSHSKWIFNIMLVFVLSGLWHGANYTFLIWGALHGVFYLVERFFPFSLKFKWLNVLITFLAVSFAWIFFRHPDFTDALTVIKALVNRSGGTFEISDGLLVLSALLVSISLDLAEGNLSLKFKRANPFVKGLAFGIILVVIFTMKSSTVTPFIYFRF
jgi:D-alanyl-lipoteichoic acid acyltransferase DltB (MBOAT superfamily)